MYYLITLKRRNSSHGDTMGLAMSRSFGDAIAHGLGVSCEPEITQYNLDLADKFLICATDGVWDVIDNAQAVQIVHTLYER
jgi:serine/threonine protein phosphatase PrpC